MNPVLIEHFWRIAAWRNPPEAVLSRLVGGISTGIVAAINRVSPTPDTAKENPPNNTASCRCPSFWTC